MGGIYGDVGERAPGAPARAGEELGFYPIMAIAMALIVVVGFSTQLAMGRSTFASPLRVHVHAVLFMGWVALFVAQSIARDTRAGIASPHAGLVLASMDRGDGRGGDDVIVAMAQRRHGPPSSSSRSISSSQTR